jgi:hypothetical protein
MSRDSDVFLHTVRSALAQWKQSELQNSVQDDQDTTKLNVFLRKTAVVYDILKDYIDNGKATDPSLAVIVNAIGNLDQLSQEEDMLLREYLFRDLIEYPFTYNTHLINSFTKKNALDTNIVPNK